MFGIIFFLCQDGCVLLLTGPAGCGKTATVQILAKDLGVQVQEWTNPISLDFTKEDLRNISGHSKYFIFFQVILWFVFYVTKKKKKKNRLQSQIVYISHLLGVQ